MATNPGGASMLPGISDAGPPAAALPNAALPALPPGVPDIGIPGVGIPGIGVPGIPEVAGLASVPQGVNAATAVVNGVLGVGNTISGTVSTTALAVTYVVLAYNALQSSGILPAATNAVNGAVNTVSSLLLPVSKALPAVNLPGLGLPGLPSIPGLSPASLVGLLGTGGLPSIGLPGLPGASAEGLISMAAAALPGIGLPSLPGMSPQDVIALAAGSLPQLAAVLPTLQGCRVCRPASRACPQVWTRWRWLPHCRECWPRPVSRRIQRPSAAMILDCSRRVPFPVCPLVCRV
ncbi:hypothetical protein H7I94_11065, partial [Mycobacterium szulgai]|nr:hypothetical protein [Mycobacterium szulgai]